jgi:hypothetical protein
MPPKPIVHILPVLAASLWFVAVSQVLSDTGNPAAPSVEAAPDTEKSPAPDAVKLPGLTINSKERCVDVEATVCLDEGALELVACAKDSKEHESIIVVAARPIHIHTALLLLGAKNGNPPMRRPLDKEMTRWADVPARGDAIEVFLEFKDATGKATERPISDFIKRSEDHAPPAVEAPVKFPYTFVFAGSQLRENGGAPKEYLADLSGHVISIASFGDELLCLSEIHSQDNGALVWSIDPTHLPKPGTAVTLRLRFKKDPAPKPGP